MLSTKENVQQQNDAKISVDLDEQEKIVQLWQEGDDEPAQFPGLWLRDNCRCEKCYYANGQSRLPQMWNNFDVKVKVRQMKWHDDRQQLHITWSDEHQSAYELNWLRAHDFSAANRVRYLDDWYRPAVAHWGKEDFERILQYFDYVDVMESDEVLAAWLQALAVHGVAMLKNAPLDLHVVQTLCQRIGFIRKTTYGEEWSVRSTPDAKNYAYLAAPLPLHTDMPYYEYKPSVTILHTLEQSQSAGGWNLLADGFNVAEQLQREQPAAFKLLTETPVDWADIGVEEDLAFHNVWRAPVINLDASGNLLRINHSIPQRDSHFSVPVGQVVPWYEANALFVRYAQSQAVRFKTAPGDVLTFNNLRVVHGRTGYDDTAQNVRHLVGGFVDWDIVYSRMRVLKRTLMDGYQFQNVKKQY